jgi:tRNA dimethylallyltransferase
MKALQPKAGSSGTKGYRVSGSQPELLVIAGQTASGKSSLAMKIAEEFNGEIISADSWTVYLHFDIGTSKPPISQQKAVKHHLLDVRRATEGFNAPTFKQLATNAVKDIQKRGKLPILAGGTGLYIDSLLYDFGFLESVSGDSREELNQKTIAELLGLATSRGIDLTDIDTRNKRRVIRAIESGGQKPSKRALRANTLIVGIKLSPEVLNKRIEQRVDQMLADGLEDEVRQLSKKYGWEVEPMKGIGYLQWREYFKGQQTLEQTRQRIISATKSLAKRQHTWFKRSPDIQWFDSTDDAYQAVKAVLNT